MAGNEDHGEGAGAAEGPLRGAAKALLDACYEADALGGLDGVDFELLEALDIELIRATAPLDAPHAGELEIDLFNALVEVGNFPDDVKVADIDHQAVAQRLVELGWSRP
jgi:hypothetical protein